MMVLNDALELGVLSRDLAEMLESALVGMQWSTFETYLRHNRGSILRLRCLEPNSPEAGVHPIIDREESSGSGDAPPPPIDADDE